MFLQLPKFEKYLQLPNYEGFANIAICPQKSSSSALCLLVPPTGTPSLTMERDVTYLPLLAGHLYIMYGSNCHSERKVHLFQSEEEMKEYLSTQLGNIEVSPLLVYPNSGKSWVPHKTPAISSYAQLRSSTEANGSEQVPPCSFQESIGCELGENLDKFLGLKLNINNFCV